jgi:putative ABC transport system permease protein
VVLALAGGLLGVLLARAAIGLLRTIAPAELPRVDDIGIDWMVLLFTVSVSVLSGALCGALAVIRFGKPSTTALKEGGRSASDAPGRHRTRDALVVGQIALALTLLIVSGLMIRTFIAMRQVDPGFMRPDEVQTFVLAIPASLISDPQQAVRTFEGVVDQLTRVPGVTSVGLSSSITMDGEDNGNYVAIEEFPDPEGTMLKLRRFKSIGPRYFETMGNRLVAGRSITWNDIYEQRLVVIISEPLAREYWGEPAKAIGKRVRGSSPRFPWREIIGVSGNERDDGLTQPPTPIVYWPMLNESYRWRTMAYAVRSTRVGAPGFVRELEQAVWSVNPNLPLATMQTLEEIQVSSMTQTSFALVMLGIAASVALLIGMVGIYGVVAYAAAQRTREIGVRMALGAQIGDVRKMFLRHGLWLTTIGIAIGIGIALVLTRVMSAFLFGVGPMDPITYAVVSAALAGMTLVATYLPAHRASRVDPVVALRAEA